MLAERFTSTYEAPAGRLLVWRPIITSVKIKQTSGRLQIYGLIDQSPNINETALGRVPIGAGRYRIAYQSRTYITSDISATIDFNKLSDQYFLQDFYPSLFGDRSSAGYLHPTGKARRSLHPECTDSSPGEHFSGNGRALARTKLAGRANAAV